MRFLVVPVDVVRKPGIGFGFGLWYVEVIERFVRFLDGSERAFHFAFRTRRCKVAVRSCGHARHARYAKVLHDTLEQAATCHRTVVEDMFPVELFGFNRQ